ncbi:hypothetical protein E6C27_scaffold1593G00230 [Cucumis melo var. makuwa]|uniref:Uncharacterized protein n=1 Tax=Cucumis melo var. makuwa TaxID=1194695 RepID=A0A5A7T8S4_CUCMM|nr:hypothetical protein E6C27_scaffold1593G00230 [Cucumis melo var. makuwa]
MCPRFARREKWSMAGKELRSAHSSEESVRRSYALAPEKDSIRLGQKGARLAAQAGGGAAHGSGGRARLTAQAEERGAARGSSRRARLTAKAEGARLAAQAEGRGSRLQEKGRGSRLKNKGRGSRLKQKGRGSRLKQKGRSSRLTRKGAAYGSAEGRLGRRGHDSRLKRERKRLKLWGDSRLCGMAIGSQLGIKRAADSSSGRARGS